MHTIQFRCKTNTKLYRINWIKADCANKICLIWARTTAIGHKSLWNEGVTFALQLLNCFSILNLRSAFSIAMAEILIVCCSQLTTNWIDVPDWIPWYAYAYAYTGRVCSSYQRTSMAWRVEIKKTTLQHIFCDIWTVRILCNRLLKKRKHYFKGFI